MSRVRHITFDALMLALLCVIGMFSIPLGDNIKVSLQLFVVFIICLISPKFYDCLIVTTMYFLLGLFLPVYAGFTSGISPTTGFVIAFIVASPAIYFLNCIPKIPSVVRMLIACLVGLLIVYLIGSIFLSVYLSLDYGKALMVAVVPYLPFDAIKIALAIVIVMMLPKSMLRELKGKKEKSEEKNTGTEEEKEV